jgi:predicted permease
VTLLTRIASVVQGLTRRTRREQELDDELQAFVDLAASDKLRDGVSPAEARRQALIELGGVDQVKEQVRTRRHGALMEELARDTRYALRTFVRTPGLTVTIVLTLALGIGANTAIFSLIDALMLRWMPVPNPQELVQVTFQGPNATLSYVIVRALANQKDVFAGLAGFSSSSFNVGLPGSADRVPGAVVTGRYYETLGLQPIAGRLLTQSDDEPGAPRVAVISDGYWERQFGRSPQAVGQTVLLNNVAVRIAGVSPPGFVGASVGDIADITIPVAAVPEVSPSSAPLLDSGNFWLHALARPKTGVSLPETKTRLAVVWPQISGPLIPAHWPAFQQKEFASATFDVSPGGTGLTYLRDLYRRPLWVLMSMVAVVLLICCANVASLLLARASTRNREIALRFALGAGRGRILRQMLMESTLLSLIGAVFGLGIAWVSDQFLIDILSTGPAEVVLNLHPNWHILGFTSAVAVATGILFGLAPALQRTAAGLSPMLKSNERMSGSRSKLLPALVSAQVTLSMVLLIGAGLFVGTVKNLQNVNAGFKHEGVLLVNFEGLRTPLAPKLVDEVLQLPGVASASVATHTPLSLARWTEPAVPSEQSIPERDNAIFIGAGPGFFATMQTPLVAGREFTERDSAGSATVAVISETYARRFFPGQDPIGHHLSAKVRGKRRDLEVIGIARDVRSISMRRAPYPTVYVPYAQLTGDYPTTLEVRVSGSLTHVAAAIQKVCKQNLPAVAVDVRPFTAQVEATIVQERMIATLATGFGVLALLMSCIGIYGLLAYTVARQKKEIGIRMALGARSFQVIVMVLRSAVSLVLIGVVLGLPAAWVASRWIESMLFGLKRNDPFTLAVAVLLLVTSAMLAAYLPARRASRVDPMMTLRNE